MREGRPTVPIRSAGLIVNITKPKALQFAPEVIAYMTERDVEVRVDGESAPLIGRDDLACAREDLCGVELLITLGGDGTILSASRLAAPLGIPVLGIHMGRFGFIAEAHPNDFAPHADDIADGRYAIEERMMVFGEVWRHGEVVFSASGLNDVVVNKGARARMLRLNTSVGGDFIATYPADGVVVATPTGSTAYALSAGGPLVEPTVQALLMVPICPHTLAARPLVLPATETITMEIDMESGDVLVTADSQQVFPLEPGDRVTVRRADYTTKLVTLGKGTFYKKIRERLLWGERLNA
jgi:NAD+ kinase